MTDQPDSALPDYPAMEGWEIIKACKDDAAKWAAAFRQTAIKLGYSDMDEGWLIGWFANAIEVSGDYRRPAVPVQEAAQEARARKLEDMLRDLLLNIYARPDMQSLMGPHEKKLYDDARAALAEGRGK